MYTLSYSSQGRLQLFCNCKISPHESFLSFWSFLLFLVLVRKINFKRAREIVRFLISDVLFYAPHLLIRICIILLGSLTSDLFYSHGKFQLVPIPAQHVVSNGVYSWVSIIPGTSKKNFQCLITIGFITIFVTSYKFCLRLINLTEGGRCVRLLLVLVQVLSTI